MNGRVDWFYLLHGSRARVYLLWAVIAGGGFLWTHYWQLQRINLVWTVISLVGLGYMFKVMPLKIAYMRRIFYSWLIPITFGMAISIAAFYVSDLARLIAYLGVFWLVVMAAGYLWNGLVDRPAGWYYFAVVLNLAAAALCYYSPIFLEFQYLVAAIITAWSMLYLWLLRT